MALASIYISFKDVVGVLPVQPEDLKIVLDWCPLSQRALATYTEDLTGFKVDQSSISRYLRGINYPCHNFLDFIGRVFPNGIEGDDALMILPTGTNLDIPKAIQNVFVNGPSGLTDSPDAYTADTPSVDKVAQTVTAPQPTKFPISEAYAVSQMARKAQVNEGKNFTFSTRKLILWGQVYMLMRQAGYDHQPALAGAYHMAVLDKQTGDDKKVLRDFFQSKLSFDANMPDPLVKDPISHPMQFFLELLVRAGLPVWTHGPTGCGKTFSAERICERLYPIGPERSRSYLRFQGSIDKTVDDLVGGYGAKDGNTIREYGPLAICMQEGIPFIYDEPTAVTAEVAFEFHAVLEGNPLIITKFRGEAIYPKPGFTIIACDNTIGQGEANEYVGTNMMNEAFRDRFLFIEYDFMPTKVEKKVVEQQVGLFNNSLFLGTDFKDGIKPKVEPDEVKVVVPKRSAGMSPDEILALLDELEEGGDI